MPALDSDALMAVHYDDERRELHATFRPSGETYIYSEVPRDVYDALLAAESHGKFLNEHIRDKYWFRQKRR